MNCVRCGFPLEEGDQFCKKCGAVTGIKPVNKPISEANQENNIPKENIQPTSNVNNDFNEFGQSTVETPKTTYTEPIKEPLEESNTTESESKKNNNTPNKGGNNKVFIVIIGMLVVILIGLAIFVAMTVMKQDSDNDEEETKNEIVEKQNKNETENKVENKTENKTSTNNKTNTVSRKNSKTETITFKGFELEIPDGIICEVENDNLYITNEDGEWIAQISIIEEATFEELKEDYDMLEKGLKENGITVSNKKTVTYSGVEFISIEANYEDIMDMLISVCEADKNNSFEIDIYEEYNYEALREIAKILSGAKYTGAASSSNNDDELEGHNIEIPSSINVEKIHEALRNN